MTGKTEISNHFNIFFTNIGPSLARKIQNCNECDFNKFLTCNITNTIFLNVVTENEIINIVSNFKAKSSYGIDEINMIMAKKIISNIVRPLNYIFNMSLKSGIFPDDMKVAKIIPLFKAGDKKEFSNYRPVSILPVFKKI